MLACIDTDIEHVVFDDNKQSSLSLLFLPTFFLKRVKRNRKKTTNEMTEKKHDVWPCDCRNRGEEAKNYATPLCFFSSHEILSRGFL